jgi:hypothetical protein
MITLKNKTVTQISVETFELKVDDRDIIYIEHLNDKGKVIDMELRDSTGNSIDDAALLERIQNSKVMQ